MSKKTQRQGFVFSRKQWVAKTRRTTNKQDASLLKTTRRWSGEASHQSKDSGYQKKTLPTYPVTYLDTYLPLSRAPVARPAGTGGPWKSREICSVEETNFYGRMGLEAGGHVSDSVALRRSYPSVDFWTLKSGQVTTWVLLIIITNSIF